MGIGTRSLLAGVRLVAAIAVITAACSPAGTVAPDIAVMTASERRLGTGINPGTIGTLIPASRARATRSK